MRRIVLSLAIAAVCLASAGAQQTDMAPQTPRQALMEMFFSKTPGTFQKHLPVATRTALEKSGALASFQQYSVMATQMQTQSPNLQTFDSGPLMLVAEDPKTAEKFEIAVASEAMHGEHDDINLTFRMFKNGQEQRTPFMPQMTFSMKKEEQIWKLDEISLTLHLPLADPDLLKAITEKMTPQPGAHLTMTSGQTPMQPPRSEVPMQSMGSDAQVLAAMRTILTAEQTYAARYPVFGYACSLSTLDGFGSGEPSERQAMLISSSLASGKRYGFVFTLTECAGMPAGSFHLTAVPNGNAFGRKAFCADQSGVIRSSDDGSAATCLASGTEIR
jgi:hypothetical protein